MWTFRYAAIAAAMAAFIMAAPGPATAADCEVIEDRRARTDCIVKQVHHAMDSYRVNTCARQIIAAAMTMTIADAGLHRPQALWVATSNPKGTLLRLQNAVAESSKPLADLLWLLFGSDKREERKEALNICVRTLGNSPFDSEPIETVDQE